MRALAPHGRPSAQEIAPWHTHRRRLAVVVMLSTLLVLAGCGTRSGGGYYKDDGPGSRVPADIAAIPNAVPRIERHAPANFRPYEVFGVRYQPIGENQPYRQTGIASWYGKKFHGSRTANGEVYDMYAMTAAHPTLPLPSYAQVTRPDNGRTIIVRINDRGPFHSGRIIDLSWVAAAKLGLIGPGSGTVVVQAITNADIRAGRYPGASPTAVVSAPVAPAPPPMAAAPEPASEVADALSVIAPAAGGIYLQYGAFSSADNAQALATRVNAQIEGLAAPAAVSRQASLYKVRSGPYASRDHAAQEAGLLQQTLGLQPVIALDQGF